MKKFDYNFRICPICDRDMYVESLGSTKLSCKNGCCIYDVDPQGETVFVTLFDDEENDDLNFYLELYKEALLRWEPLSEDDYKTQKKFDEDMKRFLKTIEYWREDDRYLIKILEGKNKKC